MDTSNLSHWLWPALSVLLAILWLWTLLRQRRPQPAPPPPPEPMNQQVDAEDLLKAAYAQQERQDRLSIKGLARSVGLPEALASQATDVLRVFGWIEELPEGELCLTNEGQARAQELIRAHRLWETYLVDREGMALDAVHEEAHRREHGMTPEELEHLDAELGHPAWDPHGHPIPGPSRRVPASSARPLSEAAEPEGRLRIVSLDDEPSALLAQLVALGLKPGVDIQVVDQEPDLLRLQVNGEGRKPIIPLAHAAADHVFVVATPALPLELGRLPVGARARVVEVKGVGKHQRRMLDMGFVPGAEVTVMRKASLGDPIQYRVKGTGVAMRRTDANSVIVEEMEDG